MRYWLALLSAALSLGFAPVPKPKAGPAITNGLGMRLALVPAGEFLMGSPDEEREAARVAWGLKTADAWGPESPRHRVKITRRFYMGAHEVTQRQYREVTGESPSSFSKAGDRREAVKGLDTDDFPVETVSWDDAQGFIKKLNALPAEREAGRVYRLPTEAEWECACRGGPGGSGLPFHLEMPSETLSHGQANFHSAWAFGPGARKGKGLGRPCKVGSYRPNKLGLFDMHGNVREWCSDHYGGATYRGKDRVDPQGPKEGKARVLRGGDFLDGGINCRAARRGQSESRGNLIGFRVVCVAP
jgi:formylglycine-generating enzyme required for sulfatase activity